MLWAALAYSAGILAGTYLARPTSWWIAAAIAFLAAAFTFWLEENGSAPVWL